MFAAGSFRSGFDGHHREGLQSTILSIVFILVALWVFQHIELWAQSGSSFLPHLRDDGSNVGEGQRKPRF